MKKRLSSEISGTSFSGAVWRSSKYTVSANISSWYIRSHPDQGAIKKALEMKTKNHGADLE